MKELSKNYNAVIISIGVTVALFMIYSISYKGASSLSEMLGVLINDTWSVLYFIFIIIIQPLIFMSGKILGDKINRKIRGSSEE
jgi:ABC-type methionine transport system permease subunit